MFFLILIIEKISWLKIEFVGIHESLKKHISLTDEYSYYLFPSFEKEKLHFVIHAWEKLV